MNRLHRLAIIVILLVGFILPELSHAQLTLTSKDLPRAINETSGLEVNNGLFLTFNDSGGTTELFIFDQGAQLLSSIPVEQTKNVDWEDITADLDHYYIADTGNNYGKRCDQKIYILSRSFVLLDSITISYKAQTSFKKRKKHPFDAEALASFGNQLVLFSKDRKTQQSSVYLIDKKAGHYTLKPQDSLEVGCLVTGADYHQASGLMGLTGYSLDGVQYLFLLPDFSVPYDQSKMETFVLPVAPAQIEAIHIESPSVIWMTSEDEGLGLPRLFKATIE
ncbi:MAG: hypothetical protein O3C07_06010 [Bacteroidetes bacterium]|nr:hypothetical protein [Bacteroidota bacterium]MDA1116381.1 hypothetical protein [Bacteroidota bacterium]